MCTPYPVVSELVEVEVDDVCTHSIEEILRV